MSSLLRTSLLSAIITATSFVSGQALAQEKGVIATVNGNPITESAIDNVADQLSSRGEIPDRNQILLELINMEVLTQAAEKINLDDVPEVAAAIQLQYTQTMANAYLARIGTELTFTDEELRAEYDLQTASVDSSEYQASHILVESQETADLVLTELAEGKFFDALAKIYSLDPSGETGGDLGWVQSNSLPPEFIETLSLLDVGQSASSAVKTEYGYHIIKLTDKRSAALPDFESVKSGLADLLSRKALTQHLEDLKSAAEIKQ